MCCFREQIVGGNPSLSAMKNKYQRNSGMLSIRMPFGEYTAHTNLARRTISSLFTVGDSASVRKADTISLSAFKNMVNHVAFPIREKRPLVSHPVKAWKAGRVLALSTPSAVHIGLTCIAPDTIETAVFTGNMS